ncbi:type I-E CRISPR-associated protein Cas7/Cse4/CasC [uncultured Aquabacterium sp.]|nr:type I-E CRISPR-associated protein Cas7/Cse4/CasC [Aquabacterium sp.]|tara:strand:- start:337 stop:1389 length:1053 start_codon:yes stop_codon:yes gene_type:complete
MSAFIQLHVLTSHAPSNLNRDDTGRPKTALMGDALRLRISSQSQKRAWRTSDVFEEALGDHLGARTRMLGKEAHDLIKAAGVEDKKAREWARQIAACFGKPKSDKKTDQDEDLQIEQLAHVSPAEHEAVLALAKACGERKAGPDEAELKLLTHEARAVDIAMFGRMLADAAEFNVEAAVQVAHAITVHRAAVEDDYFSAVDDLNPRGAGHIGERGYGAGLFYLYVCINRDLLKANLNGDDALTRKALDALLQAITKVSPTGMQNSFASRAYASYVLAEKGAQQPRSLSQAFIKPVKPFGAQSMLTEAIGALTKQRDNFNQVYGACSDEHRELNAEAGTGSLQDLAAFVQG